MITVACVYWGTKFSKDYVYNLKAMIERNTTVPHRFVCLTDRALPGIECVFLKPGYDSWWNKIQLFDGSNDLGERVVYFDLDTLIVNNIDWLLTHKSWFMGIEDVGAVNKHQPHLKNKLQSGVLSFERGPNAHVWSEFVLSYDRIVDSYRGDGEYLDSAINPYHRALLQHKYPNQLKSYKYQVYPGPPDDKTSIICFHGRPSIEQAMEKSVVTSMRTYEPQSWIKDYWRA